MLDSWHTCSTTIRRLRVWVFVHAIIYFQIDPFQTHAHKQIANSYARQEHAFSIKAKEKSIKKTLAKQTKAANSGGGGKSMRGPNAGIKAKTNSAFNKCIKTIYEGELLPCIAFTFSRPKTVELAENLESNFDFTDVKTKGIIRRFIK